MWLEGKNDVNERKWEGGGNDHQMRENIKFEVEHRKGGIGHSKRRMKLLAALIAPKLAQ
jgi:hypothetical protein